MAEIKKKIKQIIGLFTCKLEKKKATASHLVYINNQVLIPKLEYILQTVALTERELNTIHQPFLRLIKRKLGIAQTVPNSILAHGGTLETKLLANAVLAKQTTALFKRLNSTGTIENITKIRIRQGILEKGIVHNVWRDPSPEANPNYKGNIALNTIEQCKKVDIFFGTEEKGWSILGSGATIASILDPLQRKKSMKQQASLGLYFVNQLLDIKGENLLTWQQVKALKN